MKIGVIGSGSVGVGICNYLLTLGSIRELILYNRTLSRAQGEILDFQHTSSLTFSKNTKLVATNNFQDLQNADIIVITAGAQIREGQNRLDIAYENSIVGVEIAKELEKVAPNAVLIVVTNPCDIVTYFISSNTGFDKRKVISAGCVIDTARLMSIVSKKVGVDPKNVFGYIIGEHGENCFTPKSLISIAGQSADYYCAANNLRRIDADQLLQDVKEAGYEILKYKKNTTHGISASVFRIIQAISVNEHSVLPIGTLLSGEYGLQNVVLSLPCVINENGVESILTHPFTDEEKKKLYEISNHLQMVIREVSKKTGLKMHHSLERFGQYDDVPKIESCSTTFDNMASGTVSHVMEQKPNASLYRSKNTIYSCIGTTTRRITTASNSYSFVSTLPGPRSSPRSHYPSLLSFSTSSIHSRIRRCSPQSFQYKRSNKTFGKGAAAVVGSGVLAVLASYYS